MSGRELRSLGSQAPGAGKIIVGNVHANLEILLRVDQVRILNQVAIGLEDQGPGEVIGIDALFTRDAPKGVMVLNHVIAQLGRAGTEVGAATTVFEPRFEPA